MKILIVNEEHYFAQKLVARFEDEKYICTIAQNIDDIEGFYNTILISTENRSVDTLKVIKKNPNSIIILLAPFLSDDTVNTHLNAGATDYVIRPFSVDEIMRKIKHYAKFRKLQEENLILKDQYSFIFRKVKQVSHKYTFPLVLTSSSTLDADKLAFDIAKKEDKDLETIVLNTKTPFKYNAQEHDDKVLYFCGMNNLTKTQQLDFCQAMEHHNVIIYQDKCFEPDGYMCIKLKEQKRILEEQDIMSINDYIKYIVTNFEDKFPDTKLSAMLGISRKSLWEKRKKLGVEKKK
jgi:response regulator of citrate/malate metabolism